MHVGLAGSSSNMIEAMRRCAVEGVWEVSPLLVSEVVFGGGPEDFSMPIRLARRA